MANIVKINKVYLYMGFTAKATESYEAFKLLCDEKILFTQLTYNDPSQHDDIFKALKTWSFGSGDDQYQKDFKDFPILHWTEYYDNWEQVLHCAYGIEEIKNCTLIKNKNLIEVPS